MSEDTFTGGSDVETRRAEYVIYRVLPDGERVRLQAVDVDEDTPDEAARADAADTLAGFRADRPERTYQMVRRTVTTFTIHSEEHIA